MIKSRGRGWREPKPGVGETTLATFGEGRLVATLPWSTGECQVFFRADGWAPPSEKPGETVRQAKLRKHDARYAGHQGFLPNRADALALLGAGAEVPKGDLEEILAAMGFVATTTTRADRRSYERRRGGDHDLGFHVDERGATLVVRQMGTAKDAIVLSLWTGTNDAAGADVPAKWPDGVAGVDDLARIAASGARRYLEDGRVSTAWIDDMAPGTDQ